METMTMPSDSNLPQFNSVWGVRDESHNWRRVREAWSEKRIDYRLFSGEADFASLAEWNKWIELTGAVDITAIVKGAEHADA